ncbi:MAG: 4Fe-4S ferredoxin [gamma proteobacterium symbiont of Ctena orbiculata]|uniref:4Fe-4S dicluster domain-containing protein n=1 Tax=Candidatus Thiodiazotropha taylori TaxID=2792791 RepID=A0A944MD17_9GAMM|nr:4Fe-4S dicluster domain-containing protein [Candidatus Thiodiazotropha taylori]PUB81294.1 MAG: 4Fe-4S ferredoxin [gamma proteobacterium symbiont of Ctena orbiculata]MBT2990429.1 4Fe-4S dicluster domain-containing protein [Candidatus Thiodiazotropha taylori]MBT2998083.1 4Fe-4S dicluster domain-containing protein [Candidatus Thiodiazotropha taylori]MBT3002294.1 4Fe-4S dicluster domain-containing protein [Candidatus Thiodiazotropha taylori]
MSDKKDKARIKEAVKRRKRVTYKPVIPDKQLGFVHNNVDCIGCRACEIACKDKNGLAAGPRFRRVQYIEGGTYPDVFAYKVNMSCNHCESPACLPTCPTGAIFKRKQDGIVDIDSTLCIGCRRCEAACPFGAPQFDPSDSLVKKCNMCVDEIEAGRKPYCVMACMMRVLDIGPVEKIWNGSLETVAIGPNDTVSRQVKNMSNIELTNPSIGFVAHSKGKVK